MTLVTRPNQWVAVDAPANMALVYAPRVNPAPWTVSVPGEDAKRASLEVVITNQTSKDVVVDEIDFTFEVGPTSKALTPTTDGIHTQVSDPDTWQLSHPPGGIKSGKVTCTLGPPTGSTATLGPGASVVIELSGIETGQAPGTAQVTVKQMVEGTAPEFVYLYVTTFPGGFYFDSLIACVEQKSALVPVAMVDATAAVTLTWNASVADVGAVDIYYSDAAGGQGHAKPTVLDQWTSHPLMTDTTFVVVVTASGELGAPLTAALATGVSVRNPALVASSISAQSATIHDQANGGLLTADQVTVSGHVGATTADVNGHLNAQSTDVKGHLNAQSADVTGHLSAQSAQVTGNLGVTGIVTSDTGTSSLANLSVPGTAHAGELTTPSATVTAQLTALQSRVAMMTMAGSLNPGQHKALTDGFAIGVVGWPMSDDGSVGYATAQCGPLIVYAVGGNLGAFGAAWARYSVHNGNTFTLPVPAGATFNLYSYQSTQGVNQTDAPTWFYWISLGTGGAGLGCEFVGPAPEMDPPFAPPMAPEMASESESASAQLIEALEGVMEKSIPPDRAEALLAALRGF